jgi:chromosome segregation ATPase
MPDWIALFEGIGTCLALGAACVALFKTIQKSGGDAAKLDDLLQALQGRLTTLEQTIKDFPNEEALDALENLVKAFQAQLAGHIEHGEDGLATATAVNRVEAQLASNQNMALDAFKGFRADLDHKLSEVYTQINALRTDINAERTKIEVLRSGSDRILSDQEMNDTSVKQLLTSAATSAQRLTTLETRLERIETQTNTMMVDIAKLSSRKGN